MSNYLLTRQALFVRDGDEQFTDTIDALVASGDCFVTLATQLDEASLRLKPDHPAQQAIEAVICSLLDLQRRYAITKRAANYRP